MNTTQTYERKPTGTITHTKHVDSSEHCSLDVEYPGNVDSALERKYGVRLDWRVPNEGFLPSIQKEIIALVQNYEFTRQVISPGVEPAEFKGGVRTATDGYQRFGITESTLYELATPGTQIRFKLQGNTNLEITTIKALQEILEKGTKKTQAKQQLNL